MMLFLYREKTEDRDCCAYVDDNLGFKNNHYFASVVLHGACYCKHDFPAYEDIETVLSESEYNELIQLNKAIRDLGYGISNGDERYERGMELTDLIKHVCEKLKSKEAKEFQQKIIQSEIEYMKEEYSLSDEDIRQIFDEYYLDYRDRAIIGSVYADSDELGYEEA